MAAQQTSEEALGRHEDEIRDLKESHNVQLRRMKHGMSSPRSFCAEITYNTNVYELGQSSENHVHYVGESHDGIRGLQNGLLEAESG